MKRIDPHVFINNAQTDFSKILHQPEKLKNTVKSIFNKPTVLFHEFSKSYDSKADFEFYWEKNKDNWFQFKFKSTGDTYLLFSGKIAKSDEKEYIEIYHLNEDSVQVLWKEFGNLLAYHIHPLTNELILFQHQYPCCKSASHFIHKLRLINKEINASKRFFVGRDAGDMIGPFYPEKASYPSTYEVFKRKNNGTLVPSSY